MSFGRNCTVFLMTYLFCLSISKASGALYVASDTIWPRSTSGITEISVCFEQTIHDFIENQKQHLWVQEAIARTWEKYSNLKFKWVGICAIPKPVADNVFPLVLTYQDIGANIRISINDGHPHVKRLGAQLNQVPSGMELNYTFQKSFQSCRYSEKYCIEAIAIHEFGHALGLAHEQNRPDTPIECEDQPQGSNGNLTIGPWDSSSVMNYCNPKWNNNGELSENDILGIQNLYGPNTKLLIALNKIFTELK